MYSTVTPGNPPTSWHTTPIRDLHHGGLARSVGAEQREDLALPDIQVDAVDGDRPAVFLAQATHRDHVCVHGFDPARFPPVPKASVGGRNNPSNG
jgi:hypothetical protein